MSNKRLFQFLYSKQPKLTMINGIITFGATGAVASSSTTGVSSVTRLGTGIYQIKLQDNYKTFLGSNFSMLSGVTGSNVAGGAFVTGTLYQITALGNTNWVSAGFDSDYTPAIGGVFVATGAGAGTGTAKAIAASGIACVEIAQNQASLLQNNNSYLNRGSSIIIGTYDVTDALANPVSGSQLSWKLWFRDSSVLAP